MVGKLPLLSYVVGGGVGAKLSMLRVVSPQKEPFLKCHFACLAGSNVEITVGNGFRLGVGMGQTVKSQKKQPRVTRADTNNVTDIWS